MSSSNRAPSKVGKGVKADKSHKTDKTERGKGGGGGGTDKQQHKDAGTKNEDPSIRDKVKLLIDMTQRSEEEVCLALYEADYNAEEAINVIYEDMVSGEWETRVKKKKNRQASAGKKGEKEGDENQPADDWGAPTPQTGGGGGGNNREEKEKSRGGRGANNGGPRLGRGWRGRERHENERNQDDRDRSEFRERRGRSGGPMRGGSGAGGRGRGGGRAGGRYPPRNNRNSNYKPMETWDNSNTWDNSTAVNANHAEDNWDDFPGADEWSTEEYQGSLADTKVFTPSAAAQIEEMPGGVQSMVDHQPVNQGLGQSLQQSAVQLPPQSPVPPIVGTLTAAQTQYFSQLQQNNDPLTKQYGGPASSASFPNQPYEKSSTVQSQSYGGSQYYQSVGGVAYGNVQAEQPPTQQPQAARTKTQRARVPPPSKIPSSAVEMPGDLNSSIGYLDVQFGALDLIDGGSTFDGTIDSKYNSSAPSNSLDSNQAGSATSAGTLDLNSSNQNASLDSYSPKTNTQSSINSALSQSLSNPDSIPPTSEHLSNLRSSSNAQGGSATSGPTVPSSNLDLSKQADSLSYPQSSTYNAYQSKANSYNSSTYSSTQTTNSYVSNQANAYVNNQSGGSYNPSSGNYQNAYTSNSSYQSANSNAFPSISQSNSYPSSNNQSYQQNAGQSVYSANSGLNSSSNYGSASTSQYNSYSSSNKLVKDSGYDTNSSTSNNSQTTTTHVTSSAVLSQTTVGGGSKTSTTLAKSSNSVVSNIPAGMPVMSTPYIMGQVPYFQQPVYSYEEMQLLQQRLPHMTTPYYDMSYQTTPTTLAAVRETALSNVGYSISDNRFTRGDNNASPVPSTLSSQQSSTLSQQQGGHQAAAAAAAAAAQPILAAAAAAGTAPPYFFATAFNTIAPNYQFGTMYTQLPAATNAHGSSNNTQYPKPGTYGSGYGSYDALNQSQEYSKGGYVGNAQGPKGSGGSQSSGSGSAGNDLTAMYAKTHALGKVNTYEKQGFHSGTPPPFTGAIHGSQNAGLAPSGTGYSPQVYIPTMAAHQQHHATHLMQQPLHQMDVRHPGRRLDSGNSGSQRSQASNQSKAGAKQPYQTSYWNQA